MGMGGCGRTNGCVEDLDERQGLDPACLWLDVLGEEQWCKVDIFLV